MEGKQNIGSIGMPFKTVSVSALLDSKQPTLSNKRERALRSAELERLWKLASFPVIFRLSYMSEEGWRATKHEKIQPSSQQELLSIRNLQLITSFVFIQRTVCDLFAQMHKHSNAEIAHSLLGSLLYPFDISPTPTTQRFTTAEGFYFKGDTFSFFFFFFNSLYFLFTTYK